MNALSRIRRVGEEILCRTRLGKTQSLMMSPGMEPVVTGVVVDSRTGRDLAGYCFWTGGMWNGQADGKKPTSSQAGEGPGTPGVTEGVVPVVTGAIVVMTEVSGRSPDLRT